MKKFFILFLLPFLILSSFDLDAKRVKQKMRYKQRTQIKTNKIASEEVVILQLDKMFEKTINREDLAKSFGRTEKAFRSSINSKNDDVKVATLAYYNDSFYNNLEKGDVNSAVDSALKCIFLGDENEINFYSFLIEYYADINIDNFRFILNRIEEISTKNNNKYYDQISKLKTEYEDVLHPKTFEQVVIGKWIAVDPMGYSSKDIDEIEELKKNSIAVRSDDLVNPLVINVREVHNDDGLFLLNSPLKKWSAKKTNDIWRFEDDSSKEWSSRASQSLFFDGNSGEMDALFLTKIIKEPNAELAKQIRKTSYEFETESQTKINISNMKFGDKMKAQVATTTTAAILNNMASNAASGYVHEKVLGVSFNAGNSKQMDVKVDYDHIKAISKDHFECYEQINDCQNRMVKWEENDSVIFIIDGKPMFAGICLPDNSPLLDEYHKINKEFSWSKPKYVFSTIGVAALSAVLGFGETAIGIMLYDKFIKKIDNPDSAKVILSSLILATIDFVGLKAHWIDKPRRKAMNQEFDSRINRPNIQKLKDKASISVSPVIGLNAHTVGVNMTINF